MVGVCIGVRHTCGFTNNSLEEHFCNGNTCSFPLLVRCGAVFLLFRDVVCGKEPYIEGTSNVFGFPGICSALATCYYKLRTLTKHSARSLCILILPEKNNFIISNFFYGVFNIGPSWSQWFVGYICLPNVLYDLV